MNLEYKYLLDGNFHPDSRVWVYQSSRLFSLSEALEIESLLDAFIQQWNSHGVPVKGAAHLFFGQFIILIADETATGVSGCSTDSSVRLMKQLEQQFNVQLFDRTMLAFVVKDKMQLLPLSQLSYAVENGFINGDTLYFNNLVQTQHELMDKWIVPVKDSWLASRVKLDIVS
ncbi:MAG TPA: hypothetical protein VHM26_01905 [Chitinophagaceae bacterium]|jgi:hypothetical protein|nr:hypothetical protein [Chitinophagaceae bacterium]